MASLRTTFSAVSGQTWGRKILFSLYAFCAMQSLMGGICMAANLGSRSLENDRDLLYPNNNKLSNSDEIQNQPGDYNPPSRINSRYSRDGVEHGKSFMITVYQWNNHLGRPASVEWTDDEATLQQCKDIPIKYKGKVRSINTHNNCAVLYGRDGCRGAFRIVKVGSPSHNRLSDLCFHKKPMSVRPCREDELQDAPQRNHL